MSKPPTIHEAAEACLPDLEHYASTHGPGPDRRLDELRDALSWARTLIDDPGAAMSKAETLDTIDAALADEPEAPGTLPAVLGVCLDALQARRTMADRGELAKPGRRGFLLALAMVFDALCPEADEGTRSKARAKLARTLADALAIEAGQIGLYPFESCELLSIDDRGPRDFLSL